MTPLITKGKLRLQYIGCDDHNISMKMKDLLKGIEDLGDEIVCVVPNDSATHDDWNPRCKCRPFVQAGDKGFVIIHNSIECFPVVSEFIQ